MKKNSSNTAQWACELVDAEWVTRIRPGGWTNRDEAKRILPVYSWPDGSEVWSITGLAQGSRKGREMIQLCWCPPPGSPCPWSPDVLSFYRGQTQVFFSGTTPAYLDMEVRSAILTFLTRAGIRFDEPDCPGPGRRSLVNWTSQNDLVFEMTWMEVEDGRFPWAEDDQVEAMQLLSDTLPCLLPFRQFETWIRDQRRWPDL